MTGYRPVHALPTAVWQTVVYGDLFEYPLTASEIQRYLVGVAATAAQVQQALAEQVRAGSLGARQGYYFLSGREALVETRRRRGQVAAARWPGALRYGLHIAGLPWVRMVTVTGALAVDNVEPEADIDFLIVTEPGRLWLCRLSVIALVRLAARRGDLVCPNYFLSRRALTLWERNLFTARELAQMVPLAGMEVYHEMRNLNQWAECFLPNAAGAPPAGVRAAASPRPALSRLSEAALGRGMGEWADGWEMARKVRKFRTQHGGHREASFSRDWCKGHFDGHGQRILSRFEERLAAMEPARGA